VAAASCELGSQGSVFFHLIGRILTAWFASLLWSIMDMWKDSVFSPVIMVIFAKPEIHFSKRVFFFVVIVVLMWGMVVRRFSEI
jgi:membrane-bound metal-dependent hydrolase YbcI (DUF457 family)